MTFAFHPEAKAEFYAAIDYYERVGVALGLDFSIEVFSTIQNIVDHPRAWPVLEDNVRRCLVYRFPYGVLYSIGRDEIFILAVMHLHRDPDYWKSRV
ncbi:MAG: type II toxin-antitoxin system RelE/ParE family toxin [Verrucomicrobiia bacterium]|jgi:plasmid stabilization system protein ParE